MQTQEVIEQFGKYVIGNYGRMDSVIVKGQGCRVWASDGKEYLDMFPGWAVSAVGHCHPKVVEAIRRQAGELIHIDNTFYSEPQGRLAQMLSERGFGGKCFFCNSGRPLFYNTMCKIDGTYFQEKTRSRQGYSDPGKDIRIYSCRLSST